MNHLAQAAVQIKLATVMVIAYCNVQTLMVLVSHHAMLLASIPSNHVKTLKATVQKIVVKK